MNEEMERIWEESILTSPRHYPGNFLVGLKNTRKLSFQLAAGSQTEQFPNTSIECYHSGSLLGDRSLSYKLQTLILQIVQNYTSSLRSHSFYVVCFTRAECLFNVVTRLRTERPTNSILGRGRNCSLLHNIQISSGAQPASHSKGIGCSFRGDIVT
jgi:hypothetical protein